MSDATKYPTLSELTYFQWSNPTAPTPQLARALSTSDTTVYFSAAPKDKSLAVITAPFLMGVKIVTGIYKGYTLLVYCPSGANGTSGLSATGVTVGIAHNGLDFTAADSDLAVEAPAGSPIFCADTAVLQTLMVSALQGSVATGGSNFRIGTKSAGNVTVYFENGDANPPFIRFNDTSNVIEFSPDGVSTFTPGTAAGSITGGDGISVTAGDIDVDLTDTTVFVATSSGAGDNGKVPRLNASGKLPDGFIDAGSATLSDLTVTATQINNTVGTLAVTGTAGEAVDGSSDPQLVCAVGSDFKHILNIAPSGQDFFQNGTGTKNAMGDVDARARRAQSFVVTDAVADTIKLESLTLLVEKTGAPADNFYVEIQTDSAGDPSGTVITNGTSATIAGGSITTSLTPQVVTWATPPTLTSGTTYWFVIRRSGALDAANYYEILDSGGNTYANGGSATLTASLGTWSNSTTDYQLIAQFTIDGGGKIALADANNHLRANIVGFTKSNVAAAGSISIVPGRFVDDFTTPVSEGAIYYASATPGAITDSITPGDDLLDSNALIQVASGYSATTVVHEASKCEKVFALAGPDLVPTGAGAVTSYIDVFFPCGFSPREIEVVYFRTNVGGTTTDYWVNKKYIGVTEVNKLTITGIFGTSLADLNMNDDPAMALQSIKQNGFIMRIQEAHEGENVTTIKITARA